MKPLKQTEGMPAPLPKLSRSQVTELLDAEIRAALAGADYFVVSLYHGGAHESHPLKTLGYARAAALLMPKARGSARKAIVYAISAAGASVMIPDDFPAV